MDPSDRLDGEAFDEAVHELIATLTAFRAHVERNGPSRWLPELDRDLQLVRDGDAHGLSRFLGHFGSMGSLGEIGVGAAEPLLSRAHLLAQVLRRSLP